MEGNNVSDEQLLGGIDNLRHLARLNNISGRSLALAASGLRNSEVPERQERTPNFLAGCIDGFLRAM